MSPRRRPAPVDAAKLAEAIEAVWARFERRSRSPKEFAIHAAKGALEYELEMIVRGLRDAAQGYEAAIGHALEHALRNGDEGSAS